SARTMSSPAEGFCRVCREDSNKRCQRCKYVFYCSTEHQKSDWKAHKPFCKPSPDPGEERARRSQIGAKFTVKAFLLKADADAPRMVDVTCTVRKDEDDPVPWHNADLKEHTNITGHLGMAYLPPRGEERRLTLHWDDEGMLLSLPFNKCVMRLAGGPERLGHPWQGDMILVHNVEPHMSAYNEYDDVMWKDLDRAVRYFQDYGRVRLR
ncbi:hypothetical protein BC834DRAFT_830736, partial [Gloeopeniophorella convolvens]